jgi:hypothetical protein
MDRWGILSNLCSFLGFRELKEFEKNMSKAKSVSSSAVGRAL